MLLLRNMHLGPLMAAHETQVAAASGNSLAVPENRPAAPALRHEAIDLIRAHPAQARTVAGQMSLIVANGNVLPPQTLRESFVVDSAQIAGFFGGLSVPITGVFFSFSGHFSMETTLIVALLSIFLGVPLGGLLGGLCGGFAPAVWNHFTGAHALENKDPAAIMLFAAALAMRPEVKTEETEAQAKLWMKEVVDGLYTKALSDGSAATKARETLHNLYLYRHDPLAAKALRSLGGNTVITSAKFNGELVERALSGNDDIAAAMTFVYTRESKTFREGLAAFSFWHHERLKGLARENNATAALALNVLMTLDHNHPSFDHSVLADVKMTLREGALPAVEIGEPLLARKDMPEQSPYRVE